MRSVKTASASRWKVALVAGSTVGSSVTAAPALQLGTRATPATTEAAAAVTMVARRRLRLNLLDFNDVSPLRRYTYRETASSHGVCVGCEEGMHKWNEGITRVT
ncbi:hypothetical protein GCM10010448_64110 [Streptomyces glomeratus]|uniref:Secreted protein n=1 Tax=Streptomyces glomeratus TaxID=284452 RepID=A0ABP6M1Y6_9ACTN